MFLGVLHSCKSSGSKKNTGTSGGAVIDLPEPGFVAEKEQNRIRAEAGQWYAQTLETSNFNGEVLVAKNGQIIFEKYRGTVHLNGKDTINSHSAFHVASVSKTFTAMSVLKLAEAGKLSLDDAFQKYFPLFDYPDITIRTLLNHRSGLPNYLYFMDKIWPDKKIFLKNNDVLQALIKDRKLIENIAPADSHFSYSNTNYALLALLIEKVSGQSYPVFIKENIFDKFQMEDSYVYVPADSEKVTPNYDGRGQEIKQMFLDDVYGDKNIYSTVRDLLQWDRALRSGLFLSDSSLAAAYKPYSNEKEGIKNYGLGWRMDIFPDGKKFIFHNGWWHGNTSAFLRLIDEKATIIVLSNKLNKATYKAKYLANIFYPYFDVLAEEEAEGKQ